MKSIFEQDKHMLTFMEGFETGELEYILGVDIPTRVYKARFVKDEDDNFVLTFSIPEGDDFSAEYFFSKPAVLSIPNKIQIILMNTEAIRFSQSINDEGPQEIKVTYRAFSTEVDSSRWKNSKHCAYIKYSKQDFHYTDMSIHYDFTTNKNQQSSWRNAFVLQMADGRNVMVSFEESEPGDNAYCVIRAQKKMDVALFESAIEAVRVIYGLLAGYSFADRGYIISDYADEKPKGRIPLIFRYFNRENAKKHKYPLLDKRHYVDDNHKSLEITGEQLNRLVKKLVGNEEYLRAAKLLVEASAIDGSSRGVLAVVALETIANQLIKKEPVKKIIEDKETASQLNYELKKALKKVKEKIEKEAFEKLESKVNAINNLPNAVKLESVFKQVGIELDEEELYCVDCRNRFLHGALPKNDKFKMLSEDELLFMVSQRLIMLTGCILLKGAGFSGHVNDWGFTEVMKKRQIRESLFVAHLGNAHREI